MALPVAFANLVNPTGPNLDSDLSAVGTIGTIPCTVSGAANAIVMTPNTNTPVPAANPSVPTVAAYGNYMRFSGVATATNSGPTTIAVGALPALSAYKDTAAGPVAMVGTEIVQNCLFEAVYDSTLNAGAGGFHVRFGAALNGSVINPAGVQLGTNASTLTRVVSGLYTVSYTVVPAQTTQDVNAVLTNAQVGDVVTFGLPAALTAGLMFVGRVPAAGTIALRAANVTAASIAAFSLAPVRLTAMGFVP
jgi:hypothetical protein